MNRNCLFSKAVALLLCAVLLIGYLPSIALPAAAADDKWEGEPDVVETTTEEPTTPPEGAETNPIFLTNLVNNVNVPAGRTIYYTGRFSGMLMTVSGKGSYIYNGETTEIDGIAISVSSGNDYDPYILVAIVNDGAADAEYTISFEYPLGTQQRPDELVLNEERTGAVEANSWEGYFFSYKAEYDGTVIVTVSSDGGWTCQAGNSTTVKYGDQFNSTSGVNTCEVEVSKNDVVQINVNTIDPANPESYDTPAGNVTVCVTYKSIVDESLKFANIGISFQEYIGLQPYIRKTAVAAFDSFYVEAVQATINGDETEILEGVAASNFYMFRKQILSWDMTDVVTFTLYAEKDGILYRGETVSTSVEALALDKLAGYATSDLIRARALVDMLNYGSIVQTQYSHNAENLPNRNLGEYASLGTTDNPEVTATYSVTGEASVPVYRFAMSMQSKVELQFVFKNVDVSAYELRYTVDGVTTTIKGTDFSVNGTMYFAKVAIKASNMRKEYTVALYDPATDLPVSEVYTCSVESYINSKLGSSLDELYYAVMKYGDAVAAIG